MLCLRCNKNDCNDICHILLIRAWIERTWMWCESRSHNFQLWNWHVYNSRMSFYIKLLFCLIILRNLTFCYSHSRWWWGGVEDDYKFNYFQNNWIHHCTLIYPLAVSVMQIKCKISRFMHLTEWVYIVSVPVQFRLNIIAAICN